MHVHTFTIRELFEQRCLVRNRRTAWNFSLWHQAQPASAHQIIWRHAHKVKSWPRLNVKLDFEMLKLICRKHRKPCFFTLFLFSCWKPCFLSAMYAFWSLYFLFTFLRRKSRSVVLKRVLTGSLRPAQHIRPVRPRPYLFSDSVTRFSFKKRAHTTADRNRKPQNNCFLLYSTNSPPTEVKSIDNAVAQPEWGRKGHGRPETNL